VKLKDQIKHRRKYNKYSIQNNYVIGYINGKEFYCDLEDYSQIKEYCWYIDNNGYLSSRINNKLVRMHRFIMNFPNEHVDHINHNKLDNRKSNLRLCDQQQNSANSNISKNNTSGYIGVTWSKKANKWMSQIKVNSKVIYLGIYYSVDDAVKARLEAEAKYYGEFAPQRNLFKQYNIDTNGG